MDQRWDLSRSRIRQDSAFSFGSESGSQNFGKKRTRIRSHFSIFAVAGVYAVNSYVKICVNYGWIDDCSRSLNRSRILKFEKLPDPDSKILEKDGVGV